MQNISHSFPKRSFISSSNGGFTTTHKSVYDDVFGGAKKNELPTLAPRWEDYTEIFGGFHASRSFSIPVLDIPVIEDELELHFDYAEVFGGSRGFDWAPYYEEVVRECSGGDDDSDELWSPAQSGSMSNEVDPFVGSDRGYRQLSGYAHQLKSNMQFDMSFKKSKQNMASMAAEQIRETNVGSTPECSCSHSETSVTWSGDDEYCNPHVTDNNNCNQYFDGKALVENRINPSEKHGSWTCPPVRPFMTLSDISLRTKPSRLPPPSRPPPALAVKRGESGRANSNHKVYKNYAFESDVDESDKLFLDVEVDVASSADDFDKKWITEDVEKVQEKVNCEVGSSSSFKRDRVLQSDRKETRESISSVEDEIRPRKVIEEFSEPLGRQNSNHIADNSAGPVAWRAEPDFYEVVEKNISSDLFETAEEQSNIMQFQNPREGYGSFNTIDSEAFEQNEDRRKSKSTAGAGAPTRGMKMNEHKMARDDCHWVDNQRRKKTQKKFVHRNVDDKVTLKKLAGAYSFNRITPDFAEQPGKSGKLIGHVGYLNREIVTECNVHEVEPELKISASSKKMELDKKFIHAVRIKENIEKHEEKIVREEYHKRIEDVGRAEIRERLKERIEQEGTKKKPFGVYWKENEDKPKESQVLKENYMIVGDVHGHGGSSKKSCTVVGHGESSKNIREDAMLSPEVYRENERLINVDKPKLSELTSLLGFQHYGNGYGNKKEREVTPEVTVIKEKNRDPCIREPDDLSVTKPESESGYDGEIRKTKVNLDLRRDACAPELIGDAEKMNLFKSHRNGRKIKRDTENDVLIQSNQLKVFERTTPELVGNNNNPLFVEKPRASYSHNGSVGLEPQFGFSANESEAGVLDSIVSECKFNRFGKNKDEVQDGETRIVLNNAGERSSLPKYMLSSKTGGGMPEKTIDKEIYMEDDDEQKLKGAQFIIKEVDNKDSFSACLLVKESVVNGGKRENVSLKQSIQKNYGDMRENLVMKDPKVGERIRRDIELENEQIIGGDEQKEREKENEHRRKRQEEKEKEKEKERENEQIRRREEEKRRENEQMRKREEERERQRENEQMKKIEEEKKREHEHMRKREEEKERVREIERMRKREEEKERERENERIRKREEEREREREREKDMMAVDKAALEAHERSYVEAREREERPAVERANTEPRQRTMPVAREPLGRTSVDARHRVERAAVERATAEARQRAFEQSMTEKFAFNHVGKSVSDRFSASYKSADTNNGSLSSDNRFKNTGISSGSGHAYGSAHVGAGGESPQRCKARLDRYRRTADRVANALAEKNRRDLLVQKEKEERNRVAETLDAEVRRWSSGKEGNLRALLSTLQYILGPDSGWQPVPLTEVITSAAVKKSYRKATLCVHPDKLQQRGASIQQKYLCEKVFDLLKEAWSRFNSEER